ncbi:IS110 family transposase [Inhella sp.]|uniref:IS110 family transposase n=1 Tax=Inhella sp. TaxID=1921806 RepID=UPI0035AE65CF
MTLYAAIDLHSNNSVLCVLDETDRIVYSKRLPNDLGVIEKALLSCPGEVRGVAVESTYNWYWLVDGLQDAGFTVHLVNTCAVKQYDGLKHSGDLDDARHLAHLLRLGILPTGHIYPREERALRDLLRKRSQLVRQRTSQILSMQNLLARNLGARASGNEIKRWTDADIAAMPMLPAQRLALMSNRAVMDCLDDQVKRLESAILSQARERADYQALNTVPGIGKALALTIALESGDMDRFADAGHFASYARTVDSRRESNGKKKGSGNVKCGNKHLAWAFIEAAHFAVRYDETIRRWFQKKCSKSLQVVATKAVAHKLARACFHVMKTGVPFDAARAFG